MMRVLTSMASLGYRVFAQAVCAFGIWFVLCDAVRFLAMTAHAIWLHHRVGVWQLLLTGQPYLFEQEH